MADHSGFHGANLTVDLSVENGQNLVRAALNRQVEAVIADLEADYQSRVLNNPQVRVSFEINYDLHSLDTQADMDNQDARHGPVDINQDIARLNLDSRGHGETHQHGAEDQPGEQARPTVLYLVRSILGSLIGPPVSEPHPHDIEDQPHEESGPSLHTLVGRLLDHMPVVNLDELEEDSKDCPVCQEPYSASESYDADTPITLPCSHVIGRACLERWMLGLHDTCPCCRATIFALSAQADEEQEEAEEPEPMTVEELEVEYREAAGLNARIRRILDTSAEDITRAEVAALDRDMT